MSDPILTDADQERIKEAVSAAERRTSGEIVPYIVGRSGGYEVAVWRAASILASFAMATGLAVAWAYEGWGHGWLYAGWGVALLGFIGGTVGALLAQYVPALKRLFAGQDRIARRVDRRAGLAFLEEEVFHTRDRTGILLFVSLFEHRIVVLGDSGINEKVEQSDWEAIVATIRRGIRSGHFADGMVEAIGQCGQLLETKGVAARPDDFDELKDDVRVRDR